MQQHLPHSVIQVHDKQERISLLDNTLSFSVDRIWMTFHRLTWQQLPGSMTKVKDGKLLSAWEPPG